LLNLFRHVHQAARLPDTNGQVKRLLHHFDQPIEARAATGKNKAGRNLRVKTGAAHFVADQRQKFLGARLDDVGKHAREDRAGRAITNACDFNRGVFLKKRGCSTAVMPLDPFGFGDGRAQADREIVCEVVAANGNRAGVADDSAAVNDKFCRAATDIEEAGTEIAFVLREASFGGSERFDDCVTDQDSGAIRGRHEILRGDHRGSDNMNVGFEALADHAYGVANAVVSVHGKFVRQDVEDFAIFGKRNIACGVDRAANVFTFNVARAIAESDTAAAI
jgi:hypothetical protein